MLVKQKELNRWFWRWHIIGGLICLPVMLLLSVTGILYLFKSDYNHAIYQDILQIEAPTSSAMPVSYQRQLNSVQQVFSHPVMQVVLPETANQTTGFRLHSHGGHARNMVYTHPYTGEVLGEIQQKQTLMYTIRKLHGEILLGTPGTLLVEWVASWFVVLIVTGLYIWWPAKKFSLSGFFTIRRGASRRIFWRDIHAVFGFWLSIFMLVILAGGMPWTDVFGSNLKWVQDKTDAGYPENWRSTRGLTSQVILPTESDQPVLSVLPSDRLSLDAIVSIVQEQELKGRITIKLPIETQGVFSVSNRSFWLSDQQVLHFDQYSGELVQALTWHDVGILMDLRQVAMRLHQGEYGKANWYIVFVITLLFTLSTAAGLVAYVIRKPKGRWGLPEVPDDFGVSRGVLFMIAVLAVLFPLFGASVIVLWAYEGLRGANKKKKSALSS